MTRYRTRALLAVWTVALIAVAGCSGPTDAPSVAGASSIPPGEVVERALNDVERYWTTTYPRISDGKSFEPVKGGYHPYTCLLYTSPSPRDQRGSRMPSSA